MLVESGYALYQDFISVVKTDPYPDMYGDMANVVPVKNEPYNSSSYTLYINMTKSIDPTDAGEIRNIVEAAANPYTSFEAVMQEWNNRWENGRPDGMTTMDRSSTRPAASEEDEEQEQNAGQPKSLYNTEDKIMLSST